MTLEEARRLDAQDELARFRSLFYRLPETIYLDGNSLGLLSAPAEAAVLRVLDEWKRLAIEGWSAASPPWFFAAETLACRTASLLGAEPEEVIVANSTTVNLHQLLATLFQPESSRRRILTDALNFPSDQYAVQSHLRLRGLDPETHLVRVGSEDGLTLSEERIIAAMTDDIQIALLPSVLYHSGQLLDMPRLTRAARERGILIGFDCAHSIGAMPHALSAWGVDFAFWCNYKYLCNGPGGTGGLYLNRRHFGKAPGLSGWFGSKKSAQFAMAPTLEPAEHAGALQIGTPNLLSMAPLEGTLAILEEAGIARIRAKSLQLTAYLRRLVEVELKPFGFSIATPAEDSRRGGHLALLHPESARLCKALRLVGVVPDYRPPQIVRLAPVALYTTFEDCYEAVQRLKRLMEQRAYESFDTPQDLVT